MNYIDACSLLGVAPNATDQEKKQAFRRLALVMHPDKGGSNEAFRRINEAYEAVLAGPSSAPGSEWEAADRGAKEPGRARTFNFGVASAAMQMLNLDPDEFVQIEMACHGWLGGVSDLNKRAAKQLLWLAVGRVPVGAAVSVAKGQRFKSAAKNMLHALDDIRTEQGMKDPWMWLYFANCYMQMLKLSGAKSASREFDRDYFLEKLIEVRDKSK